MLLAIQEKVLAVACCPAACARSPRRNGLLGLQPQGDFWLPPSRLHANDMLGARVSGRVQIRPFWRRPGRETLVWREHRQPGAVRAMTGERPELLRDAGVLDPAERPPGATQIAWPTSSSGEEEYPRSGGAGQADNGVALTPIALQDPPQSQLLDASRTR
jgi:hypothetical protein